MRLSNRNDWNYEAFDTTLFEIQKYQMENEWLQEVWRRVPDGAYSYLELGCSPGFCTAAIAGKKEWKISGIDFSNSESIFLKTLSLVGKEGHYHQGDIFDIELNKKFDIVASYGLIEHFSGEDFEKILDIHDRFLNNSGYLIIEIPNFTGMQYVWHFLFDRPNLNIHNTKIMNARLLSKHFETIGYEVLYNDYLGVFKVWGASSFERYKLLKFLVKTLGFIVNSTLIALEKIGVKIQGRYFSPVMLLIAKKL
jgi:2-polyprenyl-3-methyl-5-hydroxy-6-metoxy-1,4-benzoquinol methylase